MKISALFLVDILLILAKKISVLKYVCVGNIAGKTEHSSTAILKDFEWRPQTKPKQKQNKQNHKQNIRMIW